MIFLIFEVRAHWARFHSEKVLYLVLRQEGGHRANGNHPYPLEMHSGVQGRSLIAKAGQLDAPGLQVAGQM